MGKILSIAAIMFAIFLFSTELGHILEFDNVRPMHHTVSRRIRD